MSMTQTYETNGRADSAPSLNKLKPLIISDKYIWLLGCLLSFVLGAWFITGDLRHFFSNLQYPYMSLGDGQSSLIIFQRILEGGWYFFNDRMGFPFGSCMLDYPIPETGQLAIVKILGLFTHSPAVVFNLTYLLGFPLSFFSSYIVLRGFKLKILYAFCASLIFTCLPFHFLRLPHLFLSIYFIIPFYFYYGYHLLLKIEIKNSIRFYIKHLVYCILLSSMGAYYCAMGALVIFINGAIGSLRHKKYTNILYSLAIISGLLVGLCLNNAPNLVYRMEQDKNEITAVRHAQEAEVYGLKLAPLLIPRLNHRMESWAAFSGAYHATFPISPGNTINSLGFIGSLGLLAALGIFFLRFANKKIDTRLEEFSFCVLFLFLFATIGGFSSLFAYLISPQLRAWDRASIFLGFAALSTFFLIMQIFQSRISHKKLLCTASLWSTVLITFLALLDQTTHSAFIRHEREIQRNDAIVKKQFIHSIEKIFPENAPIYQIPYMYFPECYIPGLPDYELGIGFLYSRNLRWSYGVIGGRDGDIFYTNLGKEPLDVQLDVIKNLGFQGIYIDTRGLQEKGPAVIEELTTLLGYGPELISPSGLQYLFRVTPTQKPPSSTDTNDILKQAGYFVDKMGKRSSASLAEGIDFTQDQIPYFLKKWRGISQLEPWGRWSFGKNIQFIFRTPLPLNFVLGLKIHTFQDQEITIEIGDQKHVISQKATQGLVEYTIPFTLTKRGDTIRFIPARPVSPASLGISPDARKLAIGFVHLSITE